MTTAPIHSVKHVKATYHRYQILALISAIATIIAVLLAALFSFQLSRISKNAQRSADTQMNSTSQTLNNQITFLNQKIKKLEEQSAEDKQTIKGLENKTVDLNKRLAEAWKAAAAKTAAPKPSPGQQSQPQTETISQPPASEQSPPTPGETEQPVEQDTTSVQTETTASPAPAKPASEDAPSPPPAEESNNTNQ